MKKRIINNIHKRAIGTIISLCALCYPLANAQTVMLDKVIAIVDDDVVMAMAGNYRNGVFMATPVFDGAKEDEIKALLHEAGLESNGQTTLS